MKKLHRKGVVLLIALALLLTCAVSGTVAYLSVGSGPVTNTFTPAVLDTVIVEAFNKQYGGAVKSSIKVQNNGNIDAYVRVGVYGYWAVKDGGGNEKIIAPWSCPGLVNTGWTKDGDWHYYSSALKPGELTSDLLGGIPITQTNPPASYPNAYLVVNVIHQSVQAEPADAAKEAWNWTVPYN